MMDSGAEVIVLDVREQSEYDSGHIHGAVLLPSGSVSAMAAEVLPDKNATILVYCRSGSRSGAAARTLVSLGYTQRVRSRRASSTGRTKWCWTS